MNRNCPICDKDDAECLHSSVVACRRCGFVYADTAETQADYDRFYATESKYAWDEQCAGRFWETAYELKRWFPDKNDRIVDIGCANGRLLAALRDFGYKNLVGFDPSEACAALARQTGAETFVCSIDTAPDIGLFDGIILSHVLEHIRDVKGAVTKLRAMLAPAGRVYIEVPDAARYCKYVRSPFQDFNAEHINHFTHQSLDNLRWGFGFRTVGQGERILDLGTPYPAIWQVWEATNSLDGIKAYIETSRRMLEAIDKRVAVIEEPILVWGVGVLTRRLLETELGKKQIDAFLDGNPINHGKRLRNRPIQPPEAARDMPNQPILIGSLLHEQAIIKRAKEIGLTNRLLTLR